jgi:hypothetical protein
MAGSINAKAAAWDLLGGQFWTSGRVTARPTIAEINIFLEGIAPKSRIAVIGASTKYLVDGALARGLDVTVLDFSIRMCEDLGAAIGRRGNIRVQDITADILPEDLIGQYDVVLSDRLFNRFTREESVKAFSRMLELLRAGGNVRASARLGLYPMDERMIMEGERRGTLSLFYDEATRTIDFPAAGTILEACLMPHGEIDRETLLGWYRRRGRESRYENADILEFARAARTTDFSLDLVRFGPFPDANETMYYVFEARSVVKSDEISLRGG